MSVREQLLALNEDLMFLEPEKFDAAILGVANRAGGMEVVAYDADKVIDILAQEMDREAAVEWYETNTLGSWMGDQTPVFIGLDPT